MSLMSPEALHNLLAELIDAWESEVVEFKGAGDSYSTSSIGKYFSALANEANLRGQAKAWLVFGVDDQTRRVIGTDYRMQPDRLQGLKQQIADGAEPSISFRDIHSCISDGQRVLLFEVPAAPLGIPIAWQGHYYARSGESLSPLGLDKLDAIRAQTRITDWSAQAVEAASLADLSTEAVERARAAFARKYANRFDADEVRAWSDATFLDRARVTVDSKITRTTLLLLGRAESAYRLSPHPAQLTWKLVGQERAYEHFAPPFLLSTTSLYQRIRNIQLRILPDDELFPIELAKYDQKIVLEALHNCIAHQDYSRQGRIVVTELPDRLLFENEGGFFEGRPDDYVDGTRTPRRYRNPFLAQAMTELNMIDTMGYGIHEMYTGQARRYFPMPDYELGEPNAVQMTLYGSIVDPAYTRLLIQRTDLALADVLALDRVQKKISISEMQRRQLRRAGLIEGRRPNLHVSASVASATNTQAEYIRTRAQDDEFYAKMVMDYLAQFGQASRMDIDRLLHGKLSDALDDNQKQSKINNLLTNMRRAGKIANTSSKKKPSWRLAE